MTYDKAVLTEKWSDPLYELTAHEVNFFEHLKRMPEFFSSAQINEAVSADGIHTGKYNSYLTVLKDLGLLKKTGHGRWKMGPVLKGVIL